MRIKNWQKFQHYKDRCPPWIKLHFELLSSADWVTLNDTGRVLAIACMLVASRHDGEVPNDPAYIKRVAYLNAKPNFKPLIACGFLIPDDDCKQMLAVDTQESEAEAEKRQRQSALARVGGDDFDRFWKAYPKKRNKGDARKAWKSAKDRPPVDALLAAVTRAKRSPEWTKDGGQFVPYPATWLRAEGWDDEIKSGRAHRQPPPPQTREEMLAGMTDEDREKFLGFEREAVEKYGDPETAHARYLETLAEVSDDEEN